MAESYTPPVHHPAITGYRAWVADLLKPEIASQMFEGYAEALALIAQRREAMRQADIAGPGSGKTAGWSPNKNFKLDMEVPYVASLLLKIAFGPDALTNPIKRREILKLHPEFSYRNLRR